MKRSWKILVPVLATVGLLAAAVPTALAGEMDNDRDNNRLKVRMTLRCDSAGSVTLTWRSISPRRAASMGAAWYDINDDPDLLSPTPSTRAEQVDAVTRRGDRASGSFRIEGARNGHRIALFVDAYSRNGNQVFGLGRNIDTIRC